MVRVKKITGLQKVNLEACCMIDYSHSLGVQAMPYEVIDSWDHI